MDTLYYVVKYAGPFGFIKPWTAVRDGETYSQQFLTPSIVEGMEKKLFPELLDTKGLQGYILRHRLSYTGLSTQQEQTWSKAWVEKNVGTITRQVLVPPKKPNGEPKWKEEKVKQVNSRPATGILNRVVLIEPWLYLAFAKKEYALKAVTEHICLCRNEDVLLPDQEILTQTEAEWNQIDGFELRFTQNGSQGFRVGYNRFNEALPMYGELISSGDPIRKLQD